MNKKFSTLVASLLLAGAWMTANAELIVPTDGPVVGKSYVIGVSVSTSDGKVTGLLSADMTIDHDDEAALTEFGNEWTLETASIDGVDDAFYLKNAEGKYLGAGSAWYLDLKDKKEDAYAFYYDAVEKKAKLAKTYSENAAKDFYLSVIDSEDKIAVASATHPALTFTSLTAPSKLDESSLIKSIGSDYYFVGTGDEKATTASAILKYDAAKGPQFVNVPIATQDAEAYEDYLWKVSVRTAANKTTYTFTNKAGKSFDYDVEATSANGVSFNSAALKAASGNNAKDLFGLYQSVTVAKTGEELNAILYDGFNVTIKKGKDDTSVIDGTDVFAGKLTAVDANGDKLEGTSKTARFRLMNEAGNYIVLDEEDTWGTGNVGANKRGAKFVAVKDADKAGKKYNSYFEFSYVVGENAKKITKISVYKATIGGSAYGDLFIQSLGETICLTTTSGLVGDEKLPYITLEADNIVPVKDLAGKFWRISFAGKKNVTATNERYKIGGVLATKRGEAEVTVALGRTEIVSVADYIPASEVYAYAPEAQWGVIAYNPATQTVTLQNRETSETIEGVQFRDNEDGTYTMTVSDPEVTQIIIGSDIVKLAAADKVTEFDGFKQYSESEVRNNNFLLGQYHAIDGNHNAYFKENHKSSHQIGVTAVEGEGDKWNLRFATRTVKVDGKDKEVVDTVFVTTPLLKLKADGVTADGTTDSRLAILPYTFQKVDNHEFVEFDNTKNANYYVCADDNKDKPNDAARFALKMKADGNAYNFVEIINQNEGSDLSSKDKDYLGYVKVKVANSETKGALRQMSIYAEDENSLMVVEKAESPEYHLVSEGMWGDTITLARKENASQVLYEKFDAKSVVAEGDTMSFLNIDNVNQFKNINPALFVDTAYVYRGTEEEPNTCYQYLLAVRHSYGYHIEDCGVPGHDKKKGDIDTVYGDFLINLVDTANLYDNIHNNWYINENEAGEFETKLAFVTGFHTLADNVLNIVKEDGDTIKIDMDTPDFNVAKFAFRYTDADKKTFKIQTQWKAFEGGFDTAEEAEEFYEDRAENTEIISNEGYLRWINGTVVVTEGFENGDEFVISERVDRNPTANDEITATEVSVIAGNGNVTVKGAAGKNVVITNVLGQTVANTVISSNNATISAPAGIVVVAVEGEAAVKAIVK